MSGIIGVSPNMKSGLLGMLNPLILASSYLPLHLQMKENQSFADFTDFGAGHYQTATTTNTVYSAGSFNITVPTVPASGILTAVFSGGFSEQSSGYGNDWGIHINSVDYPSLAVGKQKWQEATTITKAVTIGSATNNVTIGIVSTRTSGTYQEWRLGGVSPAVLAVFVSR